jgi:hypothetical protein
LTLDFRLSTFDRSNGRQTIVEGSAPMRVEITVDQEILAQFCRKHHICNLSPYPCVF